MIEYLLPPQSERHQCCRDDWFIITKWLTAKSFESERPFREREKIWFCFDFADVVLLYCRDDNSVNPARFEPRLWRRLVPNLHDFYDWAIVLICAILCVVVVVVSSSRCLGVLADILLNRFHLLYYYHRQQSNQNRFIFSRHICVNFTRPWRKCRVYPLSLRVCVFV